MTKEKELSDKEQAQLSYYINKANELVAGRPMPGENEDSAVWLEKAKKINPTIIGEMKQKQGSR